MRRDLRLRSDLRSAIARRTKFYSFAPNVDYLVNCYAYGGDPIIDKVATIIGDEEFLSVEWLKENLKLDDEVWSLKDGSKPSFNI